MKFNLSWLKDHIDTSASVEEIARTLNAIGLEVEGVENPAEKLAGFRIARVLTAERHPNADIEEGHKSTRLCHLGTFPDFDQLPVVI